MQRSVVWAAAAGIAAIAAFCALIVFPTPLFAHALSIDRITIHSDYEIERADAQRFVTSVETLLAHSPINDKQGHYDVFIADSAIKKQLFFLLAPGAGGVTYYPLSGRNVFLTGADFTRGRLISRDGVTIGGVRDLAYYGSHEISHLQLGSRLGVLRFVLLPQWIAEGLPDYVAMSAANDQTALRAAILAQETGLPHWDRFGFYAEHRYLVTYFLHEAGWKLDALLAEPPNNSEATAAAFQKTGQNRPTERFRG